MILWIPSILVLLAPLGSLCVFPIFSLPTMAYDMIIWSLFHWNEQIGLLYLHNFMNSPWRVELSSPVGFCHVSFERLGRLNSPREQFYSPWQVSSPWTRLHARLTSNSLAMASRSLAMASWLFSQILVFLSFLVSWHSIPAKMDIVRYKKRNRAIVHLFLGFSLNNLYDK